jgi:steroid Delta-isomerase
MTFNGVPAGPYTGSEQIARGYAERPPSDTMTCLSVTREGDDDVARFAWGADGGGTMHLSRRDGAVAGLTVTFDE